MRWGSSGLLGSPAPLGCAVASLDDNTTVGERCEGRIQLLQGRRPGRAPRPLHTWPIRRVTPSSWRPIRALERRKPRRRKHRLTWAFMLERVTGIEPAFSAWEADVLPLNYTRRSAHPTARRPGRLHRTAVANPALGKLVRRLPGLRASIPSAPERMLAAEVRGRRGACPEGMSTGGRRPVRSARVDVGSVTARCSQAVGGSSAARHGHLRRPRTGPALCLRGDHACRGVDRGGRPRGRRAPWGPHRAHAAGRHRRHPRRGGGLPLRVPAAGRGLGAPGGVGPAGRRLPDGRRLDPAPHQLRPPPSSRPPRPRLCTRPGRPSPTCSPPGRRTTSSRPSSTRVVARRRCGRPRQWSTHPQGVAVAVEPLIATDRASDQAARTLPPPSSAPLAGIRVLDLTRVIAGPVATRYLAAHGAEVLRIDPPGFDEVPLLVIETTAGKRRAALDLQQDADRAAFEHLLEGAHVLVSGYRNGALDALGLTTERPADDQPRPRPRPPRRLRVDRPVGRPPWVRQPRADELGHRRSGAGGAGSGPPGAPAGPGARPRHRLPRRGRRRARPHRRTAGRARRRGPLVPRPHRGPADQPRRHRGHRRPAVHHRSSEPRTSSRPTRPGVRCSGPASPARSTGSPRGCRLSPVRSAPIARPGTADRPARSGSWRRRASACMDGAGTATSMQREPGSSASDESRCMDGPRRGHPCDDTTSIPQHAAAAGDRAAAVLSGWGAGSACRGSRPGPGSSSRCPAP